MKRYSIMKNHSIIKLKIVMIAALLFCSAVLGSCGEKREPIDIEARYGITSGESDDESNAGSAGGSDEGSNAGSAGSSDEGSDGQSAGKEIPELVVISDGEDSGEASSEDGQKGQGKGASEGGEGSGEAAALPNIKGTRYAIDKVNIRTAPSKDAEAVTKLEPGDQVDYAGSAGDVGADLSGAGDEEWAAVIYDGKLCFVADRYLTDDPDWLSHLKSKNGYKDGDAVSLDPAWKYADFSEIHSGNAVMYLAKSDRKGIVVGINAGHGTEGGTSVKTWCHPDKTPKVTGGTTSAGETKAVAVSTGMNFNDGTSERKVNLKVAQILKEMLLQRGYDVLMIRDGDDVQLDNVARTVICNNVADCHIAIHFDGDGLDYDKGCFYMSVPEGIKYLDSVSKTWKSSEALGDCLISGLEGNGNKIMGSGSMDMDLTQTSYSTVPSIDIELGNQSSDHSDEKLYKLAAGLADGVEAFFN